MTDSNAFDGTGYIDSYPPGYHEPTEDEFDYYANLFFDREQDFEEWSNYWGE
jgi:hypothetical protein